MLLVWSEKNCGYGLYSLSLSLFPFSIIFFQSLVVFIFGIIYSLFRCSMCVFFFRLFHLFLSYSYSQSGSLFLSMFIRLSILFSARDENEMILRQVIFFFHIFLITKLYIMHSLLFPVRSVMKMQQG